MCELHPSVREKTDALDAAGNTTAAIGKVRLTTCLLLHVACCPLLAGRCLPATRPPPSARRGSLAAIFHLLPTCYLLPATYCLRPTACHLLLATYCLLPTACDLLPATYCLLPTACHLLPATYCLLPTACYPLPAAHYLLPATYSRASPSDPPASLASPSSALSSRG